MALAALLLIINYYVFVSLRQQIVAREQQQLQQVLKVTGAAIDHMFASTRDALESIRRHVGPSTAPIDAYEILSTTTDAAPFIRALSIVNIDGEYIHSSRAYPVPKVDLTRSPVVTHFRQAPGAGDAYVLTAPTRNSIDNQWQVISGIPVRDEFGNVAQVIAAIIDPRFIYSELLSHNVHAEGDVLLVDRNFHLIASSPWRDAQIGEAMATDPILARLKSSQSESISALVDDNSSGQTVIAAARWLRGDRLAVAATRSLSTALSDWRILSSVVGGVSIAILLLLAMTGSISIRGAFRRQQQSDAILANEQRFRLMVGGVSDHAIYMLDVDGRVSNWNQGAERVEGYAEKAIIGEHIRIFYTPEDRAKGAPELALTVAGDLGVYKAESWRVRADGSRYWAAIVLTAVHNSAGLLIGYAEVTRDISEANAIRLELKVAKESAERATAAKSEFLANMSHEIRTPLNGIIGYSDLAMEDRNVAPETHRHIARIFEASNALRVIIDDILDFSKIEARGVDLQPHPFNVRELVENCAAIVMPAADVKGLEVVSTVAADVPEALAGDPQRLRQILINLLNNAVKFTAKGSVKLILECRSSSDGIATLRFNVVDTGIGISPEDQKNLFQRFNQADTSISRRFGGTGLGLAISQRIAQAMQGKIAVESLPGEGSTFRFTVSLPIADTAGLAKDEPLPGVKHRSLKILAVDDVEMNRDLCEAILTRAGHRVTLAADGPAAIRFARDETFDAILMDVQMPGMDGLETTRRIRALEHGKGKLPILALTANVMPDQVARFSAAGMDDFISKPIANAALLAVLQKWVALSDRGAATVAAVTDSAASDLPVHDTEMLDELMSLAGPKNVVRFITNLNAAIERFPATW
ncbi:MAG: ATP-binding protein, partial [Pseudolabrys sp.]|nr:ATP-binding protein [Pseudolabrys sp.]